MHSNPALRVLILNQAFYPDVASTAQHASDLALALAGRGHSVSVIASRRCYDRPTQTYPASETWKGVAIKRIWCSGFGKGAKWRRALDFGTFIANCVTQLIFTGRYDVVIALTSPPLISFLAALFTAVRGGRFVFWVMDLNPDEAIAAGWLNPNSPVAKVLGWMLRYSVQSAACNIALDRFMAKRLLDKGVEPERIAVLPPWSHSDVIQFDEEGRHDFRSAHGLEGKFVVMYSGNHSPCHPLTTLLEAARRLRSNPNIVFAFVGGGSEFTKIRDASRDEDLPNVLCLPYQPMDRLAGSLSAADLHVVVMGDPYLGMVHPCKIYNVLTLGTPVLYIGPTESHVTDLAGSANSGRASWLYSAAHGDVTTVTESILSEAALRRQCIASEMKIAAQFAQSKLVPAHVEIVEGAETQPEVFSTREAEVGR